MGGRSSSVVADRPLRSTPMAHGQAKAVRPPQQARSRAAMERLLASAEHVLINEGPDEFTIARVADHAGVSVGGVYRRFASREQLVEAVRDAVLERLQNTIAEALDAEHASVAEIISAFASALSEFLAHSGRVIPAILAGGWRSAEPPEQALQTFSILQQHFCDAVAAHHDDVRRSDPNQAATVAFRSMIASAAHRAVITPHWSDGLTWEQWSHEIAAMATAYLTSN